MIREIRGGGLVTGVKRGVNVTLSSTSDLVGDLAKGIMMSISGVGRGTETLINSVGSLSNRLGKGINVVSQHVASGVGNTNNVAKGLGKVVKKIPIVGRPTSYIVKGTGEGIYYVVVSVGDVVGMVGKTTGKTLKKTSKLIVFHLASGRELSSDIVSEVF